MPHPLPVVRKALVNRMKEISTLLQLVFKLEKKKKKEFGEKKATHLSLRRLLVLFLFVF